MKKTAVLIAWLLGSAMLAAAQQGGGGEVRGVGTVNQMSPTPDQNQRLTGQRPLTNTGGQVGDYPDNTDRVNGSAYPKAAGVKGPAASGQGPGSATDPRVGRATDAEMMKAAQASRSGANPPGSLNPSESPQKSQTPSPGAKARTKASTGGQTNDTSKKQ